jgi:N-acetylglucosamine-6-phosphate deacetylase
MHNAAGIPLYEAIRMATLTPARILGVEKEVGSLEVGMRADLLVLDEALNVKQVYVAGERSQSNLDTA